MKWWMSLIRDEDGATAVEYAVMLALIIAVAIVGIGATGQANADLWDGNNGEIGKALTGS